MKTDPQTELILSLRDNVRAQIEIVEVLRNEVVRLNRRVTDLEARVGADPFAFKRDTLHNEDKF